MKTATITKTLGALALLASSASMAATITVTACTVEATPVCSSPPTPNTLDVSIGQNFTMTLAGDLPNVFAATIEFSYDATKVAYVSGIGLGAFTVYVPPPSATPPTPDTNPTSFYIEIPAGSVSGAQSYAQLTFQALALGPASIVFFDDDGGASGWPDFTTFDPVVADYVQANVTVVPAPAAVWLLGTGLAGLMVRSARRKRAIA